MAVALVEHQARSLSLELRGKGTTFAWSSDTSLWRAFSPKWVSGFIRPLHFRYAAVSDTQRRGRYPRGVISVLKQVLRPRGLMPQDTEEDALYMFRMKCGICASLERLGGVHQVHFRGIFEV